MSRMRKWEDLDTELIWSEKDMSEFILLSAALRSNAADYVLRRFIYFLFFFFFFLFTVRSQKLLDRFTQNFQELCILV